MEEERGMLWLSGMPSFDSDSIKEVLKDYKGKLKHH